MDSPEVQDIHVVGDDLNNHWQGFCRQVVSQGVKQTINLPPAPVYHPQGAYLKQACSRVQTATER